MLNKKINSIKKITINVDKPLPEFACHLQLQYFPQYEEQELAPREIGSWKTFIKS